MVTVKQVVNYLNQMPLNTIVVLDHMAAQALPVDGDYMTCEVMLQQLEEE